MTLAVTWLLKSSGESSVRPQQQLPPMFTQSALVLLAANACRLPSWLRPLWMCATWISTLFWKQLKNQKTKRENKQRIRTGSSSTESSE